MKDPLRNPEAELEAIEEVSKRCSRVSTMAVTPIFLILAAGAVPLFFLLRDLQGMLLGKYFLRTTLLGAAFPPVAAGVLLGRIVSKRVVERLRPKFIREAAQARGLEPSQIADSFGEWS